MSARGEADQEFRHRRALTEGMCQSQAEMSGRARHGCRGKRLAPGMVGRRLGRCRACLNDLGIDHRGLGSSRQQFVGKHLAVVEGRQGAVEVGMDFHRGADQATLPARGRENAQPSLMVLAGQLPGQLAGLLQAQDAVQAFRRADRGMGVFQLAGGLGKAAVVIGQEPGQERIAGLPAGDAGQAHELD
jgi:hypothetical protein